ncbi:MAG TPA: glutamate 5-kinase, partial [Pusillimonas sp.]|nr:glutamate 5-kinase [Pusillimonas sp.]
NYSAADTRRIMRQPSNRITEILGAMSDEELMHRDNMVFSSAPRLPPTPD